LGFQEQDLKVYANMAYPKLTIRPYKECSTLKSFCDN
jgi:hypothetical protein